MAEASYERQHLALHAAGAINAAGTSQVNFGCQLTRTGTGAYALLLGENDGLVNDESFTFVTIKSAANVTSSATVDDESNRVKRIYVWNAGVSTDEAIEVALYRSVTRMA